jgi:hypothetical protein
MDGMFQKYDFGFGLDQHTMGQNISYLQTLRKPMSQSEGKYCTTYSLNFIYL